MAARPPNCPICGRPAEVPVHRPFCSARCRRVDLGRWLGEVYRVPVEPTDEDDESSDDRTE
jgi:endogenous inhibitor of DNA gyrase (YacG/DUF329 family)